MQQAAIRQQWEGAAPGWARWEPVLASWIEPATEVMLTMEQRIMALPVQLPSAAQALAMMQEAFGAYRAIIDDRPEEVRRAAWTEVAEMLETFQTPTGFVAPAEVLVASGAKKREAI